VAVTVVGAGLAGATTARALARRGVRVEVLDSFQRIAAGTSEHPAVVFFPMVHMKSNPLGDFFLAAYRTGIDWLAHESGPFWHPTGVVHLPAKAKIARFLEDTEPAPELGDLLRKVDAAQVRDLSGVDFGKHALWYPQGGWLDPVAWCRHLLEHALIRVRLNTRVLGIERHASSWRLITAEGDWIHTDRLVLASGDYRFQPTAWFPIRRLRGQLAYLSSDRVTPWPRCVICHDGYAVPVGDRSLLVGASFDVGLGDLELRAEIHDRLIKKLESNLAPIQVEPSSVREGRVAFRHKVNDHLPLVGPVPDLARVARVQEQVSGTGEIPPEDMLPGLWVTMAHGSRGCLSCPMAAEILACMICGEQTLSESKVVDSAAPARYVVRAIRRGDLARMIHQQSSWGVTG